jgi:DNA-binding LytR/AlgR family response regulator
MIKAIAIDDEAPALKVIANFCGRTEGIRLEETFQSPAEAARYLHSNSIDLLFLDIQMPTQTGLDFYQSIGADTPVIFTTAYSEYAVEGFNLNAIDYLLKPFTLPRFQQAVAKAAGYLSSHRNQTLLIRSDYRLVRIPAAEILFIAAADDYLKIHRANKQPLLARMTMKTILEMLPPEDFTRTHRSYIVSLRRIDNVRNKTIFLAGHEIPIGTNYETAFFQRFTR